MLQGLSLFAAAHGAKKLFMKHDNSLLRCFPTRSPRNIVRGYTNNRGITNQNFWRTASNPRHHAKYRGNCYPSTGNAVISVRYKLPICFVVFISYLRLCSVGLCVCLCVCVCVCVCVRARARARAFRIVTEPPHRWRQKAYLLSTFSGL
jgi:hypothetical protein